MIFKKEKGDKAGKQSIPAIVYEQFFNQSFN